MNRHLTQPARTRRRGTLMPLLGFAILAVCAVGALVLDRLWIDAAQVQLNAAAEAAALAAASRLADDDRLREPYDATDSIADARFAADFIARGNYVAGHPVQLDLSKVGDVRFGKIVDDSTTGNVTFLETTVAPTTVNVVAQSLRNRENALLLFFRGVTGEPTGDAQGHAEATIENRVIGIRPLRGSSVPALPLGILETDPTGSQQNTWKKQIDLREGNDRFGYDATSNTLVESSDGIPELTLTVNVDAEGNGTGNVLMCDLGTGLSRSLVQKQIADGITRDNLQGFGDELILQHDPIAIDSSAALVGECLGDLEKQIGKTRICLLYQVDATGNEQEAVATYATRLVAVRILKVEQTDGGPVQIIVQPSVIATRSAVLSDDADAYQNPYVYKLYLTH